MAKKTVSETVKTAAKAVTKKAANATAAAAKKAASEKSADAKEKKTTVKETVAKTAEKVKTAAKKTAAKTADKKAEVTIQYLGREVAEADVIKRVVEAYKASAEKAPAIKKLQVYIKPEENAAYYVVNDTVTGGVALF